MISEPDPTEVIPTIVPPTTPMATVGIRFSRNGRTSGIRPETMSASRRLAWSNWIRLFTMIEAAATMRATPRATFSRSWT